MRMSLQKESHTKSLSSPSSIQMEIQDYPHQKFSLINMFLAVRNTCCDLSIVSIYGEINGTKKIVDDFDTLFEFESRTPCDIPCIHIDSNSHFGGCRLKRTNQPSANRSLNRESLSASLIKFAVNINLDSQSRLLLKLFLPAYY